MNNQPTPETDALREAIDNGSAAEAEMTSLARQLECERDEARKLADSAMWEADRLRSALKQTLPTVAKTQNTNEHRTK